MVVYILCDLYPPAWAPRVAYLTQYLECYGWQPIVFTEEVRSHQLFDDFSPPCPVYRLEGGGRWMPRPLVALLELLVEWKDRRMARQVERIVRSERLPKPDALLAFSYRKYPLLATSFLSQKWDIPWVADCRDIVEQYSRGDFLPRPLCICGRRLTGVEQWIGQRYIAQRNRAIASASTVCTVSRWHREVLGRIHSDVRIIYNGYDAGLFRPTEAVVTNRFRIVYTGRLLSLEMRDPSLLFAALSGEKLRYLPIDLVFYTDDYSASLLSAYKLEGDGVRLELRPMVSSRQVPALLAEASLILLLGNEEGGGGPHGMMSTKLFEAMAMKRPLVLLPDSTSEAAELVQESGLGIATGSLVDLERYLLRLFAQWQSVGVTRPTQPNLSLIEQYTRQGQAAEFATLLNEVIEKHR